MSTDRRAVISACHSKALQELRRNHSDEFREILKEKFAEAGITVRPRLTGAALVESKIAKHKAALDALANK
jgi:hypothetical protein